STFGSLTAGGTAIGIISSAAWGLGYFGQPHIIVRFMALRSSRDARCGFVVGMSGMILCVGGAVFTALAGLAYFQQNQEGSSPTPPTASPCSWISRSSCSIR